MVVSERHACPCNGCTAMLPRHLLMCRPHWRRVPRALAAEVNGAWAAFKREPSVQTLTRYRNARAAAIAAVNQKLQEGAAAKHTGKCARCGCTDDRACPGGCAWAAPNLCTACAP